MWLRPAHRLVTPRAAEAGLAADEASAADGSRLAGDGAPPAVCPHRRLARLHAFILGVIVANAVVLGLQTYRRRRPRHGTRSTCSRLLPRDLLRRADPAHRVVPEPARLLPLGLEHVRLRRDRARLHPRAAREHDAAPPRSARARRARRPAASRPARAARRRRPLAASARLDGDLRDADPLRLRHGRLVDLRRRDPGGLGQHRHGDADALRDADARELPGLHGARHGRVPVVVDLLRLVRDRSPRSSSSTC